MNLNHLLKQNVSAKPIADVAAKLKLKKEEAIFYGEEKAKVNHRLLERFPGPASSQLVLVTSLNPTPAGEGKSTVVLGLTDALNALNVQALAALREPSMAPFIGNGKISSGGGLAQAIPFEDINLHFNGDLHAVTSATNILAALIDNHLQQGNALQIDPRQVTWKRVLDVNDRVLRQVTIGLGGCENGIPREETFELTVASEIMSVLCLAVDEKDLQKRLGNMLIGYTFDKDPLTVSDLKAEASLALILKQALNPNLVQTLYGSPVLMHGSSSADIAHGCNSLLATKIGLALADVVVTEAGFGADLGAEKFLDIKVPLLGKAPDAIVIVATLRALKMHGGVSLEESSAENVAALEAGFDNLARHITNMQRYGLPVIIAINEFQSDTQRELTLLVNLCEAYNVSVEIVSSFAKGVEGGLSLAQKVLDLMAEESHHFEAVYSFGMTIEEKIEAIVSQIYGGSKVLLSDKVKEQIPLYKMYGWDRLPICMAKTQYSLSDDPQKLGSPEEFTVTVRELSPKLGAGFIVAYTGKISTMPGLGKKPFILSNSGKISER